MSEPIKESKEKKSSRQRAMEAWAASIAARAKQPGPPPGPEQDTSGAAYSRPSTSQRPHKIKTVTQVQTTHQTQKQDQVDLARDSEKSPSELTMKAARELVSGRSAPQAKAPAPPPLQRASQAPVVKLEKAIKEAAQEEVSRAAETVTAEEVQASPGVASVVTSKSLKSGKEVDKSKSVETASDTEEAEEDQEVASLIEPGNSPKATAYVRAGDLITGGSSDPDLDDYMLAL